MSKKINLKPINFSLYLKKISKNITSILLLIFIVSLFILSYFFTKDIFDNSYVLNKLIINKEYFRGCVKLSNSDSLIDDLYDFYSKNISEKTVLPLYFNNFPSSFTKSENIEKNKYVFLSMIIPSVIKEQNQVTKERSQLQSISDKFQKSPLSEADLSFIKDMAAKYKINMPNDDFWTYIITLGKLFDNVDVIPISIVLGMAAKESGWGTSRFLIEGNSLFSQWVWNEKLGIKAKNSNNYVRKFNSIDEAVQGYYKNINSNVAYQKFRALRSKYRKQNIDINIQQLVESLSLYSQERQVYVKDLMIIIRKNNLDKYSSLSINNSYQPVCLFFE